ncbi:MAG TPA: DNRLRE domain-containing protein, partial [Micromonosporaceae bacterium]
MKSSFRWTGALAALACAAVVAAMASAVVAAVPNDSQVTATASDDSFVRPGLTGSAGSAGSLMVGGLDTAVTYVKFQVTSLPPGSGRMTVSLDLQPVRQSNVSIPTVVDVRAVSDTDWSENTLTYRNAPRLGSIIGGGVVGSSSSDFRVDVSLFVKATGTYAFALTAPVNATTRMFVSKEGGQGPRLILIGSGTGGTPTPPPPTQPPSNCSVGPQLVPTCGVLLGV